MNTRKSLAALLACLIFGTGLSAAPSRQITARAAGRIRLGMTLAQLRIEAPKFEQAVIWDGDSVALTAVRFGPITHAFVFCGDDRKGKIEHIEVIDPSYRTDGGVHPQMSLEEVEKRFGKLKLIRLSEIESREFAEFERQPPWLGIRLMNSGGLAGLYAKGANKTKHSRRGAIVYSLSI